jgi:hypothetical protein
LPSLDHTTILKVVVIIFPPEINLITSSGTDVGKCNIATLSDSGRQTVIIIINLFRNLFRNPFGLLF